MNHELPLAGRSLLDLHLHAEREAQLLLERSDLLGDASLLTLRLKTGTGKQIVLAVLFQEFLTHQPLDIANAQLLAADALAHLDLLPVNAERQQRARVSGGDDPVAETI